jgi:hypothetical protein
MCCGAWASNLAFFNLQLLEAAHIFFWYAFAYPIWKYLKHQPKSPARDEPFLNGKSNINVKCVKRLKLVYDVHILIIDIW